MLGDTLRRARCAKGWSIPQLSKRSGVPGRLIREMEGGSVTYVPSEGNTVLLGEALRVAVGRGAIGARSERVRHEELKFVPSRELGDGYR